MRFSRSLFLFILLILPLLIEGSFFRQPYDELFLKVGFLIAFLLVFWGCTFAMLCWSCFRMTQFDDDKTDGCCANFTWIFIHFWIGVLCVGIAGFAWVPTIFDFLHVSAAIILSTFFLWFCWLLFGPPSILSTIAQGKRKMSAKSAISKKLKTPPYCVIFYVGLLVIFAICFCFSYFLEDSCFFFFPFELNTKFDRRNYKAICEEGGSAPCHVYLTVPEEMATEMIVNFHTLKPSEPPFVFYDNESYADVDPNLSPSLYYRHVVEANQQKVYGIKEVNRWINWADLVGLEPDTVYYFRAGTTLDGRNYTSERSFRTAPLTEPYNFMIGGDMGIEDPAYETLRGLLRWNPLFLTVCGDIAYDNGPHWCYTRWDEWFYKWDSLRTSDGHAIPLLTCAGNHEGGWDIKDPPRQAAFYQPYFPHQTGLGGIDIYDRSVIHTHKFGEKAQLIVLDSGHYQRAGKQVDWLEEQLFEGQLEGRFPLAMYHIGIYRSDKSGRSNSNVKEMKKHWGPLFDSYGLMVGFEQHDHSFKRTYPLKDGQITDSDSGTVYLGDGAIGVEPFDGDPWKLFEKQKNGVRHGAIVTVFDDKVIVDTLNQTGDVFDEFFKWPIDVNNSKSKK
mmetsp:Transcript_21811/g.30024  ORF Transcript_21811/g.30024 Transcript_21811/m.30024 type:complete len:614 (-) Transcript_21811:42-1883(-)